MFDGIRNVWQALGAGNDVADELIKQGGTDISEGTLRNMAGDLGIEDEDTFVETVFDNLNDYDEDEWTRQNGSSWEQFRRGAFSDDHPILRRIFG
jgi:hypothetical protein